MDLEAGFTLYLLSTLFVTSSASLGLSLPPLPLQIQRDWCRGKHPIGRPHDPAAHTAPHAARGHHCDGDDPPFHPLHTIPSRQSHSSPFTLLLS